MFSGDNPTSAMDLFCIVISAIVIFMGIYQIYKKRLFGQRNNDYTEESVKKWGPVEGIIYLVLGAGGIFLSLTGYGVVPKGVFWPGMIFIIAAIVADGILIKKKFVPKNKKNGIDVQKHMLK